MPNYSHGTKLALAATDEPPYLTVGTDVSAKYKGAFCEAKIIDVSKNVKVRVLFDGSSGNHLIDDTELKAGSTLEVGAKIEARHPEKKQQTYLPATITKILDHSRYTVVFDDGDQCILRRSSICLKSGKHFAESETLDQLPLTNPEHFGNPVKVGQATEQMNNQHSTNNNNTNSSSNNNNNNGNINQQAHNDKQSSSNNKTENNDIAGNKSSNNKIVTSDNSSTTTNGRAVTSQNNIKQENSDKPTSRTKTSASSTATTTLSLPGRRSGKGRKARESTNNSSKLADMADDPGESSQDSTDNDNGDPSVSNLIEVGVKLMVQYGKGKIQNVYEAKVNKIETNSAGKTRYFVHYTGWNNRYDEWVTKNRILSIVTDKENGVRDGRSRHQEMNNSAASSNTNSSTTKESNSVKDKDAPTPAKGPRRSRLTETSSTAVPTTQASSSVALATTTAPPPTTTVATSARERDKTKDKAKEVPTKTRRSRLFVDSSANSTATLSSASSTSSVASAATTAIVKDEPKEKEVVPPSATPSKPGRPRQTEARESVSNATLSSGSVKDRDKEPPTKTRRSKQVEASLANLSSVTSNETVAVASPPRQANNQTERDKTKDGAKDSNHTNKEDRSEKQQRSEPTSSVVNSKSTTQNSQATKDKDTEKESNSVQATKSRSSRQSESSIAASMNSTLSTASISSSASSTSSITTTTSVANASSTAVQTTTVTNIIPTSTAPSISIAPSAAAVVTSLPARDRERDKERDKEPPTKIRRSRQAASESSVNMTTSNATTSAAISTTTTASSTSSTSGHVANPSTASIASSSSSSSYSITFSNNAMSAYNLIDKERFSDLPIIDEPDCDKRISILQDKIMAIKQTYMALRSELADLDRRKKRPRLERSNSDHINFSGVTCRN